MKRAIFLLIILTTLTECKKDKGSGPPEENVLNIDDKIRIACSATPHQIKLDSSIIYAPSVFTPNHDGINDFFVAFGRFADSSFNMTIKLYDQIVYSTNDKNSPWNGIINGIGNGHENEAPEDLYYFEINALTLSGNPMILKGNVVLLRNIDTSKMYPEELCHCPTPDLYIIPWDSSQEEGYDPNISSNDRWQCE